MRRPVHRTRPGAVGVLGAVAAGLLLAVVGVVPVRSQVPTLDVRVAPAAVDAADPWAEVWDVAQRRPIRLSAQEIAAPFGGTVRSLTVRGLHDGSSVYLMVEWDDDAVDDSVAGNLDFSDAVALQFPTAAGAAPPYTMGGLGEPVNIWHWKAVWEADIERGFVGSAVAGVDDYPNADDPLYRPAARLGNLAAQAEHASAVENLVAQGFGSLTSAEVQDVAGRGEWRDGVWRVVFARDFDAAAPGLADFAVGDDSLVAFAVWDGSVDERNGQKAIAQFINLRLTDAEARAPDEISLAGDEPGKPWLFVGALAGGVVFLLAAAQWATRRNE